MEYKIVRYEVNPEEKLPEGVRVPEFEFINDKGRKVTASQLVKKGTKGLKELALLMKPVLGTEKEVEMVNAVAQALADNIFDVAFNLPQVLITHKRFWAAVFNIIDLTGVYGNFLQMWFASPFFANVYDYFLFGEEDDDFVDTAMCLSESIEGSRFYKVMSTESETVAQ